MTLREREDTKIRLWDLNFPFLDQVQKNMGILIFTENNTCGLAMTKPFKAELEITLPKDDFEKSFFSNLKKATKQITEVNGVKVNNIKINEYGETFGKKPAVIIEVYFDREKLMLESTKTSKNRLLESSEYCPDHEINTPYSYNADIDRNIEDFRCDNVLFDKKERYCDPDDPEDELDLNEAFKRIYKHFN
jgi:hypothetical protein